MAAKGFAVQYILVDQKPDPACLVIHQSHDCDGAGGEVHKFLHEFRLTKGKPGASDLFGEQGCLELFISRHEKQVKVRFLRIAQKKVLADLGA